MRQIRIEEFSGVVTPDEIVDGIIHNDENINSCVVIDDAALIDETTIFWLIVKLSPVIVVPVNVVKLILVVLIVLTESKELIFIVLAFNVVPFSVWNVILIASTVSTYKLPVLNIFYKKINLDIFMY